MGNYFNYRIGIDCLWGSKLAGVGKSLGRSIKEFKEEVNTPDKKDDPPKDTSEEPAENTKDTTEQSKDKGSEE